MNTTLNCQGHYTHHLTHMTRRNIVISHKDHSHYTEDYKDLKEQIEELIRKGKLQKFVKKGEPSKSGDDNKGKHEASPRDENITSQHLPSLIGEIKTITGRPSIGGSFKSLKKSYQR